MEELQAKVQLLSAHKQERAQRRLQFKAWKEAQAKKKEQPKMVVLGPEGKEEEEEKEVSSSNDSLSSKYQDWDLWEPSSDSESELPQADHPEFAAMKKDMEAREKKKKAAREVSDRENELGNEKVKKKEYLAAIDHYTVAIENTRSEKSFYTNRALCYNHTFQYQKAIKDCENALNIYECFEADHVRYRSDYKNMKVILKAYLRLTRAHIGQEEYGKAKETLAKAVEIIKEIYAPASRQEPVYAQAKKGELAEVEKMRKEIEEKEKFQEEERKMKEQKEKEKEAAKEVSTAETNSSTPSDTIASPSSSPSTTATSSPSSASASFLPLLKQLQDAYNEMLTTPGTDATPPSQSDLKKHWSLLSSSLRFFILTIENSDGNKEKVASHPESRIGVEAVLRMMKHTPKKVGDGSTTVQHQVSSGCFPITNPDFASVLALFAPRSPSYPANTVAWREQSGLIVLGKFLHRLSGVLLQFWSEQDLPCDILSLALRFLMLLTDRETGREYLSSPAHVSVIIPRALQVLDTQAGKDSSSSSFSLDSKTHAANLLANLAFQSGVRQWLISTAPQGGAGLLDNLISSVLSVSSRCSSLCGHGDEEIVFASSLAVIINLLTSAQCRARLVERSAGGGSSSSDGKDSPLSSLIKILSSLLSRIAESKFTPSPLVTELAEKTLAILLNLAVDDAGNTLFFSLLPPSVFQGLIHLFSYPVSCSDSQSPASESSISSALSPTLVERALGLVTRGVRREHALATAPVPAGVVKQSHPRPLRKALVENHGPEALVKILALAPWMTDEEGVSEEKVLARLQAGSVSSEESSSSSSAPTATPSKSKPFRFTRLTMEHASVSLAVCMTQDPVTSKLAASVTFQGISGVQALVSLLSSKHKNIAGNACLCIDALCAIPEMVTRPELSGALEKLLAILKDPASKSAHQNAAKAAILIGRAPNNVDRWTQMRGLEIISAVLKMK